MAGPVPTDVRSQRMVRLFLQLGGASQLNDLKLEGLGFGYAALTGITRPVRGGIDNISVRNPTGPGYINVGSMEKNPSFGKAALNLRETITGIPLAAVLENCPLDVYEIHGSDCEQLSDPTLGYSHGGYVMILPGSKVTDNVDYGDGMAHTEDNPIEAKIGLTVTGDMFSHASIFCQALATSSSTDLATTLVTDCVYGNQVVCANCGIGNDGTYLKYWCARSTTTSPGGKPGIFYQLGNNTPVYQSVTSAAIAEDLTFIEVVGNYLVVGSSTAGGAGIGGYHYATIGATGVPGSWTKVVTGFQANKEPTDILVLTPSEIYFSANGGYIYKSTDITAGVSALPVSGVATTNNLLRIRGTRSLLVATGASGTILISRNSGNQWAASPATPGWGSPSVQAVDTIGNNCIWVGSSTGRVFATYDFGNTWAETTFDSSGSGGVTDIYFANANEGYFLHNTSGNVGRIFRTYNGGRIWWNQSPAVEGLGSYYALQRLAAPTVGNVTLRSNNILVAGSDTAAKGLILSASPQVF